MRAHSVVTTTLLIPNRLALRLRRACLRWNSSASPLSERLSQLQVSTASSDIKKNRNWPQLPKAPSTPKQAERTIIVRKLSKLTTEEYLWEKFEKVGRVRGVWLMRTSTGESRRYAFVQFLFPTVAATIMELSKKVKFYLDDRPVEFRWALGDPTGAQPRHLLVSNLPKSISGRQVLDLFSKYGVESATRHHNREVGPYARLTFPSREIAQRVYLETRETPIIFNDLQLVVTRAGWISQPSTLRLRDTLFARVLPKGTSTEDVRRLFSPFGEVESVHLAGSEALTGGVKKYAFIKFASVDDASKAFDAALAGHLCLGNHPLTVDYGHQNISGPPWLNGADASLTKIVL